MQLGSQHFLCFSQFFSLLSRFCFLVPGPIDISQLKNKYKKLAQLAPTASPRSSLLLLYYYIRPVDCRDDRRTRHQPNKDRETDRSDSARSEVRRSIYDDKS